MSEKPNSSSIDDLVDVSIERFQETTPGDVAAKVRFLYQELQSRTAVRDRAVESLLQEECELGARLNEVLRAYGWFNEVGEKERVQLKQELRNLEKERRKLYESTFLDIHRIKKELVEALVEYRSLRRRDALLSGQGFRDGIFDEGRYLVLPAAPGSASDKRTVSAAATRVNRYTLFDDYKVDRR